MLSSYEYFNRASIPDLSSERQFKEDRLGDWCVDVVFTVTRGRTHEILGILQEFHHQLSQSIYWTSHVREKGR